MLKEDSRASLTEKTYAALRADILACRLRPGQRLRIRPLCSRLNVSPGAVREALSSLSAERLVCSERQKGFRVAPVDGDDLEDLTRTRIKIETACLRGSMAIGGIEWETRLVAAGHRLVRTPPSVDGDEWAAAHAEYHLALVAACKSRWLLRLREILYSQSERYLRLCLSARHGRDHNAEHLALMEAALARDVELAGELLARHLNLTTSFVGKVQDVPIVQNTSLGGTRR